MDNACDRGVSHLAVTRPDGARRVQDHVRVEDVLRVGPRLLEAAQGQPDARFPCQLLELEHQRPIQGLRSRHCLRCIEQRLSCFQMHCWRVHITVHQGHMQCRSVHVQGSNACACKGTGTMQH